MASIRKRGDTYQIRVSVGYDVHGRQIIKTKTWKPEPEIGRASCRERVCQYV